MNNKNFNGCLFHNNSRYKPDIYENINTNCNFIKNGLLNKDLMSNDSMSNGLMSNGLLYGGAGFFGEVQGPCGWKEDKKYDCCFTKCKSKWKTRLWPLKVSL
jgi:hypothetical protein